MLKKVFTVLALSYFSGFAQAEIIDMGSITRDTVSGLDWLDVNHNKTLGKNFTDINKLLSSDSELMGYRFATSEQILELMNNYFYPTSTTPLIGNFQQFDHKKTVDLIGMLGKTKQPSIDILQTIGLNADTSSGGHYVTDLRSIDYTQNTSPLTDVGELRAQISSVSDNSADPTLTRGAFLIRNSPVSSVPEPQSYLMFFAGLGLLGVASRRKEA